ncbi:MAG: PIG-L family deacetylase [Phycisphaerae bacterium]
MSLSVHSQLGPPGYFARHRRQRLLAQMRMLPGLDDYSKRAIVFSPHQDDEVLGCGGTIIKKIEQGADVHIVFMTNGRRSHAGHMEIDALIEMRRRRRSMPRRSWALRKIALPSWTYRRQTWRTQGVRRCIGWRIA